MGQGQSMEDHLFNLRFTSKQLIKESSRCEKNASSNKLKCKRAMEQGNMDGARIYAESAIRDKNQALNYLRLSSRIDAVAARVNTAVKMKTLTKDMSGIVKSMDSVMKTMNVEKINEVMDKFEKQFEDLDLTTGVMENSITSSTAQTMPESQVDSLMQQVADEHGLEFEGGMNSLPKNLQKQNQQVEQKVEQKQQVKEAIAVGASANNKKKGDDDEKKNGGDANGGSAVASSNSSSGASEELSLEERLRRLQGM